MNRYFIIMLLCSLQVLSSCESSPEGTSEPPVGETYVEFSDQLHSSNSYHRVLTEISTSPFLIVKAIKDLDTGVTSTYIGENGTFFFVFGNGRSIEEYAIFMSEADTLQVATSDLMDSNWVSEFTGMLKYGHVEYDAYINELSLDGIDSLIDHCFQRDILDRKKCIKTENSYNYLVFLLLTNNYMIRLDDITGGTQLVGRLDQAKEYPYEIDR